jgi:hypothetical protein
VNIQPYIEIFPRLVKITKGFKWKSYEDCKNFNINHMKDVLKGEICLMLVKTPWVLRDGRSSLDGNYCQMAKQS